MSCIPLSHVILAWELATLVHLSPFYFARAFQKEVGLPPHAYLENVRVKRARELLLRGVPITDVSAAVGYADQSHLTNRFKRLLGMTRDRLRVIERWPGDR